MSHPDPTPHQARHQLAAAAAARPARPRDRGVYAAAAALLGVIMGVNALLRPMLGVGMFLVWSSVVLLLFLAGVYAVRRTTRSVPRHAWKWIGGGYAVSFLVSLWVVSPWLNSTEGFGPGTALAAWLLAAAPCLAGALMILRGAR